TVTAVGDDGTITIARDYWTGTVERINTHLLRTLLDAGYFPVLTPPAASDKGEAINVDGDRAAAMVAAAFHAEALIILSNVPGLLRNFPDESSLIREIPKNKANDFMQYAEGRMKKKVMGAVAAVQGGVGRVVLGDARVAQPVRRALAGHGTVVA
ncbi:MAG TPA: [LysW]-aminoadipate kinase, partial [Trueperaceae bacterium]|nr:[LysW]-aminoadipate kinase [Trueperaceae bacterium]